MPTWKIVNKSGQTLATYRRTTKQFALRAFMDDQRSYASVFKNTSIVKPSDVTVIQGDK